MFLGVVLLLVTGGTGSLKAEEDDWFIYLGNKTPPKAAPKQISAAEALPPLPLPATPLRRTERKKPPQPDYLIGKVIWGASASFVDSNGDEMDIADWNLCPTDLQRFLEKARETGLQYHWHNVSLNDFHFDPKKLPALLFSGVRTLQLSKGHLQQLRDYVLDGGMVICDSIAGSPHFYDSVKRAFSAALPECRFRVVPADHPIYHIFVDIDKVTYPGDRRSVEPFLECLYVGSRIGVLVSRHGLGCGWNRDLDRLRQLPEATYHDVSSASAIGLNLAAYIVGYAEAGQVEARPELYGATDQKRPTDEFVFAQLKHGGVWNVHPGAATALLTKLRRHTTIRVNLRRVAVDPDTDDLARYGFLYLTGLDDFRFSDDAVAALQRYLSSGGILLINNGLGLSTFDRAVRREMRRILPNSGFQRLPPRHGLYSSLFDIKEVRYSAVLAHADPSPGRQPHLLGVTLAGDLRVVYSPYDMEAGWLPADYPLIRGYGPVSAQHLGMNVIVYFMTH